MSCSRRYFLILKFFALWEGEVLLFKLASPDSFVFSSSLFSLLYFCTHILLSAANIGRRHLQYTAWKSPLLAYPFQKYIFYFHALLTTVLLNFLLLHHNYPLSCRVPKHFFIFFWILLNSLLGVIIKILLTVI